MSFTNAQGPVANSASSSSESVEKRVALIFDDGPHENGAGLIKLFKEEGVVGSFAYIGKNLRKHPGIVTSAVENGWQVICHSSTHAHINQLDDAQIREELIGALPIFEEVAGSKPLWYWPPYGERDDRMYSILDDAGMILLQPDSVNFTSTRDWDIENTPAELILERALAHLSDPLLDTKGDVRIILFHEWRNETLQVMPQILQGLKSRGYKLVRIDELMPAPKAK